jgi:hypothetical protein
VGQKKKYKAAVVSKLIEMPFTKQVTDHQLPNKFKVSHISSNSGVGDPTENLENYLIHLALHAMLNEIVCRAFPMTLSGNTREWFWGLMHNSISTFEDLAWIFLTQFLGPGERKKPSKYLLTLHQREGESLKEFMILFNLEKLKVEDPSDGVVFSAIYQGISLGESMMRKLA